VVRCSGWDDLDVTFDSTPPERPVAPPPRSALGARQLIAAILVLLPVILLAGALSRCSFAPGGPEIDPAAGPAVDAAALLRAAAPQVPFALRVAAVPPGWRSNAVDQSAVDGGRVVRVGYVTGAGRYLRLVQSNAPEEVVVRDAVGTVPAARGTVEAGGRPWVIYGGPPPAAAPDPARRDEAVWVTDLDGVRLLLTGSAGEDEFRTLAAAVLAGEVLP
jgi:hypothetical protein